MPAVLGSQQIPNFASRLIIAISCFPLSNPEVIFWSWRNSLLSLFNFYLITWDLILSSWTFMFKFMRQKLIRFFLLGFMINFKYLCLYRTFLSWGLYEQKKKKGGFQIVVFFSFMPLSATLGERIRENYK